MIQAIENSEAFPIIVNLATTSVCWLPALGVFVYMVLWLCSLPGQWKANRQEAQQQAQIEQLDRELAIKTRQALIKGLENGKAEITYGPKGG